MSPQENTFTPRLLGYLGLIPFIASSILSWSPQFHHAAVASINIYAAVILTFIGAVHWGLAISLFQYEKNINNKPARNQIIFSVIPSLLAWTTVVFFSSYALIILAIGFGLFWWFERTFFQLLLPSWYAQLRNHLSVIAILSIIIAWLSTL